MCLNYVNRTNKFDKNKIYHGWKVMIKIRNKITFPFFSNKKVFSNQWMVSCGKVKDMPTYKRGFHILKTRRDARVYKRQIELLFYEGCILTIKKVQYKEIICEGKDRGVPVVVANKMMIKGGS